MGGNIYNSINLVRRESINLYMDLEFGLNIS